MVKFEITVDEIGQQLFCCAQASQAHCTNVWGRELSGNDYALAFVNNGVRHHDFRLPNPCT